MLSKSQIEETFNWLAIPIERAEEGSPILIDCPFQEKHSKKNAAKDARLHFDEYPHVFCFHESCAEDRRELNYTLRVLILGSPDFPHSSVSFIRSDPPAPESLALAKRVEKGRAVIMQKFSKQLTPIGEVKISSIEFLSKLFRPLDVLWIGREFDSGKPVHANRFKTLEEWQAKDPPAFWCYTTGSSFRTGSISRSDRNIEERRFLILESDILNAEETRSVFEWVKKCLELKLRAIVFSGGSSLHGWFEYPGDEWLTGYREILLAAGFCQGPLKASQPVRLGSALRENGKKQTVLWIA
jgi:hypothetical protein